MIIIVICGGLSATHLVLCPRGSLTLPLLQLSASDVLLLFGLPNTAFDQFSYPCAAVFWGGRARWRWDLRGDCSCGSQACSRCRQRGPEADCAVVHRGQAWHPQMQASSYRVDCLKKNGSKKPWASDQCRSANPAQILWPGNFVFKRPAWCEQKKRYEVRLKVLKR